MIFCRVRLEAARGGILAHNLKTSDRVLRKGALVDATAYEMLRQAGYAFVTIARLQPGDVPEGEAARRLGECLRGANLRRSEDVHGRVNLFATVPGLLRLNARKIERLNRLDEAITLATLGDFSVVGGGDMVATLKIIPFAVNDAAIARAEALILEPAACLMVKPFQNLNIGLILSKLPQLKETAIEHTIAATATRVTARGGKMLPARQTAHEAADIRDAIRELLAAKADMILISGASAVTDRQDVAPRAIVEAGGEITHFGMPVDPGNLLCFGRIGDTPAIVLPGCARSAALNGIDWVLDRLFAGETVGPDEVAAMGVGGLLKESETRPLLRNAPAPPGYGMAPKALPRVAAVVLAAGTSRRMGRLNKLLAPMPRGASMIAQTVDHVCASSASPVLVVTGHQERKIRRVLAAKPVNFVRAADYGTGMAASLKAGVAALGREIGAVLICLGDMPEVEAATLDRIIAAYDPAEGREIVIPNFNGQRGNPVLWGRRFFAELLKLSGDAGARQILHHHLEFVAEIPAASDAVLRDFDTPDDFPAVAVAPTQSEPPAT